MWTPAESATVLSGVNPTKALLLVLALSFGVACGDNSGSTEFSIDSNLNFPLEGRLILDRGLNNPLEVMDLSTGATGQVPGTDWTRQQELFPSGTDSFFPTVNQAGDYVDSVTALVVRNCGSGDTNLQDCLIFQNIVGKYVSEKMEFTSYLYFPQISPDGRFFAAYIKRTLFENDELNVYDLKGTYQYGFSFDSRSIYRNKFQWTKDGGLLIPIGEFLEITRPYTDSSFGAYQFPSYPGDVHNVRVSPDGSRVVFFKGNSFLTMNVDGSGVREFAINTTSRTIRGPVWSPDGDYVLIWAGYPSPTGFFSGVGADWILFALPAHIDEPLVISEDDQIRSPKIIEIKYLRNGVIADRWLEHIVYWKK